MAGFAAAHDMKILNATTADWLAPARPVTIVRSAYHPPLLALAIFLTGKGKLLDLEKPTQFFQCLGIPFCHEQAILAGATECVGGLLLLLELALRLISIPLMILLTVAYLTADMDKVRMIFSDPDKFLAADEFLLVVVLVFVFGPGKLSLGWLFARKLVPQETGIAK